MGRGAPKAQGNVWYQARIDAAMGNEKLLSRFGAAEAMGLSEDAVKSAELGLYKSMPVENAVLTPYLLLKQVLLFLCQLCACACIWKVLKEAIGSPFKILARPFSSHAKKLRQH